MRKRIVLQMKKWMHILFHSLKFLQFLYKGRSFIKIMCKGFHIFIEKFGHFTKNLSNDTEKHVIQRDSWLQLLMIPLLLQHCHRSRQSRLTPMHLPRIFTLFFSWQPLERPLPNFNTEILRWKLQNKCPKDNISTNIGVRKVISLLRYIINRYKSEI